MSPCWFLHFYQFTDVLEDEHAKTQNYLCNFFVNLKVFQKYLILKKKKRGPKVKAIGVGRGEHRCRAEGRRAGGRARSPF